MSSRAAWRTGKGTTSHWKSIVRNFNAVKQPPSMRLGELRAVAGEKIAELMLKSVTRSNVSRLGFVDKA